MAFTDDQQAQLDLGNALENNRHANQMALQTKISKLEALRMAKDTLMENSRSKPAGEREVTAADITAFADTLAAYVNN